MIADDGFIEDMIPYVEFADNANERTPCVLVLDCSGSMRGEPIKQLNAGLKALEKELKEDIDASSRVQLLIVKAFGKDEAVVSSDWTDAMNFEAPVMEAGGLTPLGKAMELALKKIEEQKCLYDSCGITSKRPWIFLISDGEPTDYDWEIVAEKGRCIVIKSFPVRITLSFGAKEKILWRWFPTAPVRRVMARLAPGLSAKPLLTTLKIPARIRLLTVPAKRLKPPAAS